MGTLAKLCPTCGQLHSGRGRCNGCQRQADQHHNQLPYRKGYSTRAYQRARATALANQHECEQCGTTRDLTVDHIDHDTMNNNTTNLRVLCRPCNSADARH